MEKFCYKCGDKLKKGVKFCTRCGFMVEEIKGETKLKVEQPKKISLSQDFPEPSHPEKETLNRGPQLKDNPLIIPSETNQHIQSKPVDKIILPAIIVALILSVAAIILPFVAGNNALSTGSVDTDALASNSITTAKIADGTITDDDIVDSGISKIATKAINSENIGESVIDFLHLNSDLYDAITGLNEITNESITSAKIADFTISSIDLANNSITSSKIINGTISADDIGTDAVTSSEIAANAVGSSEIIDGSIDTIDIENNAVTFAKMAIKIKYNLATGIVHGSTVNHGLGSTPTAVILTPVYNSSIGPLQANVYNINVTSFQIALWREGPLGNLISITSSEPQSVYWIAIYS